VFTASGEVFTAGSNESGQLGQTSEALSVESLNFAMVETLRGRLVRSIACGGQHTSALVARAFIEDSDANECMGCRERFTLLVRRHHCRHCGGVFCSKCTGKTLALLKYLIADPVRVCNGCYAKLTN
jgi:alpha-tubulin suppressor-like RCC1 family protein